MPRYQVTLDGHTFVLEGDHPPSEAEARQAFSAHQSAPKPAPSNAGMSLEQLQDANKRDRSDMPSPTGFAENVASSGGRFLRDAATGVAGLAKGAVGAISGMNDPRNGAALIEAVKNAPRMLSAAGQGIKGRYGSVDNALGTAYHDPVGMAADASTVAGGAGLLAKAGGASKIARVLEGASELTNPLAIPGRAAENVAHGTANTIVRGTLRPPAAVREDFGGSKAIADAVLKDKVYSEASAGRKLNTSTAQADRMLAEAQAAGTPGVNTIDVAQSVVGKPQATTRLRTRLGVPSQTQDLQNTAKAIIKNNPTEINLTDAQKMKREAQDLAYEAGADNLTVKKAAEIEKAKSLRAGIEQRVPDVGPVNEQSQRLLGSKRAFANAEDRPRALTNFLSVLGGAGGFAGGGPIGAAIAPLLIKAMDSPRAGALAGIGVDAFGKGMNANSLRQAALVARLLGEQPNQ